MPVTIVDGHIRRTINLKDAAKMLGISAPVVYRLARENKLPVPVIRLGHRVVISRTALDDLLSQRKECTEEVPASRSAS